MIAALAFGIATLQARPGSDVPLLQKVITRWTGQNGYEELVKAAILLDTKEKFWRGENRLKGEARGDFK